MVASGGEAGLHLIERAGSVNNFPVGWVVVPKGFEVLPYLTKHTLLSHTALALSPTALSNSPGRWQSPWGEEAAGGNALGNEARVVVKPAGLVAGKGAKERRQGARGGGEGERKGIQAG